MKKNYKKVLSFVLICLMICTPFVSKYIVEAENDGTIKWMTYENYLVSEVKLMSEHPEYYIGSLAKFNDNDNVWNNFEIGRLNEARMDITANISPDDIFLGDISIHDHAPVRIVDYKLDSGGNLWFKIEEVEGYPINDLLKENPYVWTNYPYNENYPTAMYKDPSLFILPEKGMIADSAGYITLKLEKDTDMATKSIMIPKALMPDFVNVNYVGKDANQVAWYEVDTSFITDELLSQIIVNVPSGIDPLDCIYIEESSVTIIPSLVSRYYEELINAQTKTEYDEIYNSIPESVLDQFSKVHLDKMEEVSSNLQIDEVYNQLLGATTTDEYYEVLESIAEDLLAKVEEKYKTELENHLNELIRLDNIEYEQKVLINGIQVPVKVKGRIPEDGLIFSVEQVSASTTMSQGFDIESATDIVLSLDIKLISEDDGSEWQPAEGNYVSVFIDMAALGYEDGKIFRFHHKHGEAVYDYDIFVVMGGYLTYNTNGFSIYTVTRSRYVENAQLVGAANTTVHLEVGKSKVYYWFNPQYNGQRPTNNNITTTVGKWSVEDISGAIYYTVHTNTAAGNAGVVAPWIEVVALKPTEEDVTLIYQYNANIEKYPLDIYVPNGYAPERPANPTKQLYIKDTVNTTGCITATLVDETGTELPNGLDGAQFTWTRSDNLFITPQSYSSDYRSVNIAVDHAGLVEARKEDDGYELVTYTVDVVLADGTTAQGRYTVYYQSEFINADFESPTGKLHDYCFFVNGTPGLYWKTTAPGQYGSGGWNQPGNNLTKDIEIANFEDGECDQGFGVTQAADYDSKTGKGVQFAELNAEAFGALYQDIITAPQEDIDWKFAHAPRNASWSSDFNNAMFIIIGATENAQKLITQGHLEALGAQAKTEATTAGNTNFFSGKASEEVDFEYEDKEYGTYKVWYHDAGRGDSPDTKFVWTELEGSYNVPDNQYRTRLFFVSEKNPTNNNPNGGNLIDVAKAGQYKSYIIEYYEETFTKDVKELKRITKYTPIDENGNKLQENGKDVVLNPTQEGLALIYSSVILEHLDPLTKSNRDYLHKILINGKNYPYDLRYSNQPSIYVEKYQGTATDPLDEDRVYTEDIVVQIYLRDTVVAVQKELEFPYEIKDGVRKELLTEEQKLKIMKDLNTVEEGEEGGYKVDFELYSSDATGKSTVKYDDDGNIVSGFEELDTLSITARGPDGKYTGYIAPDSNPPLESYYVIEEVFDNTSEDGSTVSIPGLKLSQVTFRVTLFKYGLADFEATVLDEYSIPITDVDDISKYPKLATAPFYLGAETHKIAEVSVTNTYVEKLTTINYRAIGNGKLKFVPEKENPTNYPFMDEPSETLPFYSGKATGCLVYPRSDATFKGWYRIAKSTDAAEDIIYKDVDGVILELAPVTPADGVWDGQRFKPNSNIINADVVTFYAVFETKSIRIEKTNGIPNQTYFYKVTGDNGLDVQVALKCNSEGYGFVDMYEVGATTVTVNEIVPWSWRDWETSNKEKEGEFKGKNTLLTFNFDGTEPIKDLWLNGYSELVENIFGKLKLGGGQ